MRIHREWLAGRWLQSPKQGEVDERTTLEPTSPSISKLVIKRAMPKKQDSNDKGTPPSKKLKHQDEITNDDSSKKTSAPSVSQSEGVGSEVNGTTNKPFGKTENPSLTVTEKGSEGGAASVAPKRKRGRPPKLRVSSPETPVASNNQKDVPSALPTVEVGQKKAGLTTSLGTELLEDFQVPVKEQAGILTSPLSNGTPSNENTREDLGVQPGQGTKAYVGKRGRQRTTSLNKSSAQDSQGGSKDKNLEKDSAKRTPEASVGKSPHTVSSRLEGKQSSAAVSCPDGSVEPSSKVSERQLENGGMDSENMPFVRSTSLWKTLESTDAFRMLPQKPHFRPLESAKQIAREGLAITAMVTFVTVVDKTRGMKLDEPRTTIEDCLASLVQLEDNGFDVEVIRQRLTRLLLIKDKQEELAGHSKVVLEKREEHCVHVEKIEQEIEEVDRQMRKLAEMRNRILKEKGESELVAMDARFTENDQRRRGLGTEFDGLVAAPL